MLMNTFVYYRFTYVKNDDSPLRHELLRIHEVLTAQGQSERVCDVESLNERNGLFLNVYDVKVKTVDTVT